MTSFTFNGAATFQLRIAVNNYIKLLWLNSLQWSRNFSVADCGLMHCNHWLRFCLQWSRNFSVADCPPRNCSWRLYRPFNGAATFQLRIEPTLQLKPEFLIHLQWSRNFSVADCYVLARQFVYCQGPSMEPQLFSCGLNCKKNKEKRVVIPSMEPQLFSCGLWIYGPRESVASNLQWSRNFSVADCYVATQVDTISVCLQWSRNFSVADCRIGLCISGRWRPFNGAATFQLRIGDFIGTTACVHADPSMEPQLFSCGLLRFLEERFSCAIYAFNGAATFQLRIELYRGVWL